MKKPISLLLAILMIFSCFSAGTVVFAEEPETDAAQEDEAAVEKGERVQVKAKLSVDNESYALDDDVTFSLKLTNESPYILSNVKILMFNNMDFTIVSNEAEGIDAFKPYDTVNAKIVAKYTPSVSEVYNKSAVIIDNITHFLNDLLTLIFGFLSPFAKNIDYSSAQVGDTSCQLTVWAYGYAEDDCDIFTVNFNYGDKTVNSAFVAEGRSVSAPAAPVKENAIFAGWFTDKEFFTADTLFDFDTIIAEDTVLYAGFIDLDKDADEDGLPDALEKLIGTSMYLTDTDEDGETDYDELMLLGTDPADFFNVEGLSDFALSLRAALEATAE